MINQILNRNRIKNLMKIGLTLGLLIFCVSVFADGTDLLKDTDADLISTVKGTGKTYLYIAELVIASIGFVKTRNPTIFLGILALSVGFNVLLKIAGV